jgi:hypothetical protein
MIESSTSSGDSDSNNRLDIMNMMESKNPMVRLTVYSKIKKVMQSYGHMQVSEIDKRVLRGLFVKNLKDFDDEQRELMSSIPLIDRIKHTLPRLLLHHVNKQGE